jgi:hypothetical protein
MRFRLSTLLIAVCALSVMLGIYRHRAEQQREAVRAVAAMGGSVVYRGLLFDELPEYIWEDGTRDPNYPSWLLDLLGRDYVATVVSGYIGNDYRERVRHERSYEGPLGPRMNPGYPDPTPAEMIDVRDGTIERLASLDGLLSLDLAETNVADDDLAQLSRLTNLRTLRLGNGVTNDGVTRLRRALPEAMIEY